MGASPKTKSDYRKKIANKQALLASLRALPNKSQDTKNRIGSIQGEIARLRAEMADAPSK